MPIVEPSPWRTQYFTDACCGDDIFIPTDDPEAWAWNPSYAWIFDKLRLALSQGLEAAPHGVTPQRFPVFSKPIYNFGGMGAGSRVLADTTDYIQNTTPGHMWMPLLAGPHVSTDTAIVNGSVVWMRHATGHPTTHGMFDYWTVHALPNFELQRKLTAWIRTHLAGYTGMFNAETIGGTIIDAHLRFSDQWPDLYGPGWVNALVALYRDRKWRFREPERREGFSLALFMQHGRHYRYPPQALVVALRNLPGVSSLQFTFYEDRPPSAHSMPPGGFRVAVVNAWDLSAGQVARNLLTDWFAKTGVFEVPKKACAQLPGPNSLNESQDWAIANGFSNF